jgi:hypothetical protein
MHWCCYSWVGCVGVLLQMIAFFEYGWFCVLNLGLGVCWKRCPWSSRVGFGVITLELGVWVFVAKDVSLWAGVVSVSLISNWVFVSKDVPLWVGVVLVVVTLELGVCLKQCHSMRKDGLNVCNLWIGNFVLITMLTLTRFGFGVLNHGRCLWCRLNNVQFGNNLYLFNTLRCFFLFQFDMWMYKTT